MKSEITVTMPMHEYESIQDDREFWQDRFNDLYRIVLKYYMRNKSGDYVVSDAWVLDPDSTKANLETDLERWLNTWGDRV